MINKCNNCTCSNIGFAHALFIWAGCRHSSNDWTTQFRLSQSPKCIPNNMIQVVSLGNNGRRFHTRWWTYRLDGQMVSDEQIVWCANGRNKFFDEQIVWYLAVWKDDFSQMICRSRRTSRRQYDINSHKTDKCQKICPSRQFVRPLVWKRPLNRNSLINLRIPWIP